ncbi:unnamed protein product [Chrysoparadoxa australica]
MDSSSDMDLEGNSEVDALIMNYLLANEEAMAPLSSPQGSIFDAVMPPESSQAPEPQQVQQATVDTLSAGASADAVPAQLLDTPPVAQAISPSSASIAASAAARYVMMAQQQPQPDLPPQGLPQGVLQQGVVNAQLVAPGGGEPPGTGLGQTASRGAGPGFAPTAPPHPLPEKVQPPGYHPATATTRAKMLAPVQSAAAAHVPPSPPVYITPKSIDTHAAAAAAAAGARASYPSMPGATLPASLPGMPGAVALMGGGATMPHQYVKIGAGAAPKPQKDKGRELRLAKNRESARQSRRRKKQYLELLEDKVTTLTNTLEDLRRQHLKGCAGAIAKQKKDTLAALVGRVEALAVAEEAAREGGVNGGEQYAARVAEVAKLEQEICKGLQDLSGLGPLSQERCAVVKYNFSELQSFLLPSYTRFLLWLSGQPKEFFSRNASAGSGDIWPLLCQELGVTPEQEQKLKECQKMTNHDPSLSQDARQLKLLISILEDLRACVEQYAGIAGNRLHSISRVLTPVQMVNYLKWVSEYKEHEPCKSTSELLNQIGVGSGSQNPPVTASASASGATASGGDTAAAPLAASGAGADGSSGSHEAVNANNAKLMALLTTPDHELQLEDLAYLIQWVKCNQSQQQA